MVTRDLICDQFKLKCSIYVKYTLDFEDLIEVNIERPHDGVLLDLYEIILKLSHWLE